MNTKDDEVDKLLNSSFDTSDISNIHSGSPQADESDHLLTKISETQVDVDSLLSQLEGDSDLLKDLQNDTLNLSSPTQSSQTSITAAAQSSADLNEAILEELQKEDQINIERTLIEEQQKLDELFRAKFFQDQEDDEADKTKNDNIGNNSSENEKKTKSSQPLNIQDEEIRKNDDMITSLLENDDFSVAGAMKSSEKKQNELALSPFEQLKQKLQRILWIQPISNFFVEFFNQKSGVKDYGRPTVLSISENQKRIAIGTTRGIILLYSFPIPFHHFSEETENNSGSSNIPKKIEKVSLHIKLEEDPPGAPTDTNASPITSKTPTRDELNAVTSIDMDAEGKFLICGHERGQIVIWDLAVNKSIRVIRQSEIFGGATGLPQSPAKKAKQSPGQQPTSPAPSPQKQGDGNPLSMPATNSYVTIDYVKFLNPEINGWRVFLASSGGLVKKITIMQSQLAFFKKKAYLEEVNLFDGISNGPIRDMKPLPISPYANQNQINPIDEFSLISVATDQSVFVIALRPAPKSIFALQRPKSIKSTSIPYISWRSSLLKSTSKNKPPLLTVGWGHWIICYQISVLNYNPEKEIESSIPTKGKKPAPGGNANEKNATEVGNPGLNLDDIEIDVLRFSLINLKKVKEFNGDVVGLGWVSEQALVIADEMGNLGIIDPFTSRKPIEFVSISSISPLSHNRFSALAEDPSDETSNSQKEPKKNEEQKELKKNEEPKEAKKIEEQKEPKKKEEPKKMQTTSADNNPALPAEKESIPSPPIIAKTSSLVKIPSFHNSFVFFLESRYAPILPPQTSAIDNININTTSPAPASNVTPTPNPTTPATASVVTPNINSQTPMQQTPTNPIAPEQQQQSNKKAANPELEKGVGYILGKSGMMKVLILDWKTRIDNLVAIRCFEEAFNLGLQFFRGSISVISGLPTENSKRREIVGKYMENILLQYFETSIDSIFEQGIRNHPNFFEELEGLKSIETSFMKNDEILKKPEEQAKPANISLMGNSNEEKKENTTQTTSATPLVTGTLSSKIEENFFVTETEEEKKKKQIMETKRMFFVDERHAKWAESQFSDLGSKVLNFSVSFGGSFILEKLYPTFKLFGKENCFFELLDRGMIDKKFNEIPQETFDKISLMLVQYNESKIAVSKPENPEENSENRMHDFNLTEDHFSNDPEASFKGKPPSPKKEKPLLPYQMAKRLGDFENALDLCLEEITNEMKNMAAEFHSIHSSKFKQTQKEKDFKMELNKWAQNWLENTKNTTTTLEKLYSRSPHTISVQIPTAKTLQPNSNQKGRALGGDFSTAPKSSPINVVKLKNVDMDKLECAKKVDHLMIEAIDICVCHTNSTIEHIHVKAKKQKLDTDDDDDDDENTEKKKKKQTAEITDKISLSSTFYFTRAKLWVKLIDFLFFYLLEYLQGFKESWEQVETISMCRKTENLVSSIFKRKFSSIFEKQHIFNLYSIKPKIAIIKPLLSEYKELIQFIMANPNTDDDGTHTHDINYVNFLKERILQRKKTENGDFGSFGNSSSSNDSSKSDDLTFLDELSEDYFEDSSSYYQIDIKDEFFLEELKDTLKNNLVQKLEKISRVTVQIDKIQDTLNQIKNIGAVNFTTNENSQKSARQILANYYKDLKSTYIKEFPSVAKLYYPTNFSSGNPWDYFESLTDSRKPILLQDWLFHFFSSDSSSSNPAQQQKKSQFVNTIANFAGNMVQPLQQTFIQQTQQLLTQAPLLSGLGGASVAPINMPALEITMKKHMNLLGNQLQTLAQESKLLEVEIPNVEEWQQNLETFEESRKKDSLSPYTMPKLPNLWLQYTLLQFVKKVILGMLTALPLQDVMLFMLLEEKFSSHSFWFFKDILKISVERMQYEQSGWKNLKVLFEDELNILCSTLLFKSKKGLMHYRGGGVCGKCGEQITPIIEKPVPVNNRKSTSDNNNADGNSGGALSSSIPANSYVGSFVNVPNGAPPSLASSLAANGAILPPQMQQQQQILQQNNSGTRFVVKRNGVPQDNVIFGCGHVFHVDCLKQIKAKRCPVCSQEQEKLNWLSNIGKNKKSVEKSAEGGVEEEQPEYMQEIEEERARLIMMRQLHQNRVDRVLFEETQKKNWDYMVRASQIAEMTTKADDLTEKVLKEMDPTGELKKEANTYQFMAIDALLKRLKPLATPVYKKSSNNEGTGMQNEQKNIPAVVKSVEIPELANLKEVLEFDFDDLQLGKMFKK